MLCNISNCLPPFPKGFQYEYWILQDTVPSMEERLGHLKPKSRSWRPSVSQCMPAHFISSTPSRSTPPSITSYTRVCSTPCCTQFFQAIFCTLVVPLEIHNGRPRHDPALDPRLGHCSPRNRKTVHPPHARAHEYYTEQHRIDSSVPRCACRNGMGRSRTCEAESTALLQMREPAAHRRVQG